jgi:putative transposase
MLYLLAIMPRMSRAVVAGVPHHVIQRGNRRQKTFFSEGDYAAYKDLMAQWCAKRGVEVWAYCLMPNHVHLIAVPSSAEALALAVGEAHRRYTRMVNFREGWRGHLWQSRFGSYVLDEVYLFTCARYIELNPVRAGLAERAEDWEWSSARAHLSGRDDSLVKARPLLDKVLYGWREFLTLSVGGSEAELLRRHERTGRPLGSRDFVSGLESSLGRRLLPGKGGRPRKQSQNSYTVP